LPEKAKPQRCPRAHPSFPSEVAENDFLGVKCKNKKCITRIAKIAAEEAFKPFNAI
jgi:aspartate carbamoyltransferase regulatory subunit